MFAVGSYTAAAIFLPSFLCLWIDKELCVKWEDFKTLLPALLKYQSHAVEDSTHYTNVKVIKYFSHHCTWNQWIYSQMKTCLGLEELCLTFKVIFMPIASITCQWFLHTIPFKQQSRLLNKKYRMTWKYTPK